MEPIDYKKMQKELYQPKTTPSIIEVPDMLFLMVDGSGDPNTSADYAAAVEALYGISYTIKMSKKSGSESSGYFEYVVPPLEGLWDFEGAEKFDFTKETLKDKSKYIWTSMIRQPEFVTPEVFEWAKNALSKKKPDLNLSGVRLQKYSEGLCAQIMHIGPYDDEPATVAALARYVGEMGYAEDMSDSRRHHEIYLGDPRKTAPEKLKTVIRHPIKKANG